MITTTLRNILRGTAAIRDRVDKGAALPGIYASNAPAAEHGEYIVLTDVSGDHSYALSGEIGTRQSTIQVDCYAETGDRAYSLFELVRNRISGNPSDSAIDSCLIIGGLGSDATPPASKGERWIHRYSKDFLVTHFESVPTLT